jgi:hypothetical protein
MIFESNKILVNVNKAFAAELFKLCREPGVLPSPANFKEALQAAKLRFGYEYVTVAKQAGVPVTLLDVWQESPSKVHVTVRRLVLELMYRVISDDALIPIESESVTLPTVEQFKAVLEAAHSVFPGKFSASIKRTGFPVKLLTDCWQISPGKVHPEVRQLIFDFLRKDGILTADA